MTIKKEHFVPMELADWQTAVIDKDLITSPESPSSGDRYIIAGTGGDWSVGTIKDIAWYIGSEWYFVTPIEGMQVYVNDENLYYFYNGSSWAVIGGSGDMTKAVYDTDNNGIVDKTELIDDDNGNVVSASELVKNLYNVVLLAFKVAVQGSLTLYNLVDGFIDEYEDESGIDTVNSENEVYDSDGDYYKPISEEISDSPYAHYKCNDDTSNTTVTDDGSGLNNGSSSTNTSNLSTTGKINKSFNFNGIDEYVNLNNLLSDIASDTEGTISFWVRSLATNNGDIFSIGDADAPSCFTIWRLDSNDTFRVDFAKDVAGSPVSQWAWIASDDLFPVDTWIHFALVQDGTSPRFYINGVEDTTAFVISTDKTQWIANVAGFDNIYLADRSWWNRGLAYHDKLTGKIDDFRYYKTVLTSDQIALIYNNGIGTEDENPSIVLNINLISEKQTAESEPSSARIVCFEEDVDAITLNTDLKAYISRDDGSTWAEATLQNEGKFEGDKRVLTALVDLSASGIGSGTDMVYKLVTANAKDLKVHGTALLWD